MKKRLFLLPLLGGFLLTGCTFNLFGKEIKLFEKEESASNTSNSTNSGGNNNNNSNTPSGGNNSGTDSGSGATITGTKVATVNMTNFGSCVDKTADPLVYSNSGYSVTISQGECAQTISAAVTASKTYEIRVYAKMVVTFAGPSNFSQLLIKYSTYVSGSSTYYWDFEDMSGATNDHDDTKGQAVVTFDSALDSYEFVCYHQTRLASVEFYA